MELEDALVQITEIRLQVARTEVFRGYRAMPVAFSGLLAVGGAGLQAAWLPEPMRNQPAYLGLWLSVAGLSALAAGAEMAWRCLRSASALQRESTWLAVEQFLPSLVAGGLLTVVLA